mmetsp:Transcript_1702/g.2428  ORF Transcript_1702/g.2428 Transcript_1702/m.2428 type:complete len:323 (+) Transcript_1702:64-1032(+)
MMKKKINPASVVTDEEVASMINELSHEFEMSEVEKLSCSWIRAIMSQPSRKKNNPRRSFEYSKKKLCTYLKWRTDSRITDKIQYHLNNGGENEKEDNGSTDATVSAGEVAPTPTTMKLITTTSPGSFYWYGVDNEGAPVLWYKADLTIFEKTNVQNEIEYASLILHGALDALPPNVHSLNFVILFDKYRAGKALQRPSMGPEFIKMLMLTCPDRLKRAIMVTGIAGHVFFNIAKGLAPSNIIDKVVVTQSRKEAAELIVELGIVTKDCLPDFMNGTFVHNEVLTTNYSAMIKAVRLAMRQYDSEPSCKALSLASSSSLRLLY